MIFENKLLLDSVKNRNKFLSQGLSLIKHHSGKINLPTMLEIVQKHWKSLAEMNVDKGLSTELSDYHRKRTDKGFPWKILFHHIHGLYQN